MDIYDTKSCDVEHFQTSKCGMNKRLTFPNLELDVKRIGDVLFLPKQFNLDMSSSVQKPNIEVKLIIL